MNKMILVYITCIDVKQAKMIAKHLMDKRLAACVNIFPEMIPMVFWPPKSGIIEEGKETVLIVKSIEEKFEEIDSEVTKIHSYEVPCIFSIPVSNVNKKYFDWLEGELS